MSSSGNRKFLEDEEACVDHLEQKLEKTLKMCTVLVDSGKEYVKNQRYAPNDSLRDSRAATLERL